MGPQAGCLLPGAVLLAVLRSARSVFCSDVGYRRISSEYRRIVFLSAEAFQAVSPEILSSKISWQAQYFAQKRWLDSLRALEMMVHM